MRNWRAITARRRRGLRPEQGGLVPPVPAEGHLLGEGRIVASGTNLVDDLIGVGSTSTSLTAYPKVENTTTGDWYVDGSVASSGNGASLGAAFKTLAEGLAALGDGETLLVKGGTYQFTSTIARNTNWSSLTRIMGYGSDRPILDFGGTSTDAHAITIGGSARNELWHRFYIIDTTQRTNFFGSRGMYITGSNITISDVWFSHLGGEGISIEGGSSNTVQDCAAWRLGDGVSTGTNEPDNFKTSEGASGTRFVRCFAANGPDDNYDMWAATDCQYIDCVSYGAGTYWNGTAAADGTGFKMGGAAGSGNNAAIGCIAVGDKLHGFNQNSATTVTFLRCTATASGWAGIRDAGTGTVITDCIALGNPTNFTDDGSTTDTYNTWNLSITDAGWASPGTPDWDYSLDTGSACIGAGVSGGNLGASDVALRIAKEWLAKDLTAYAEQPTNPTQTVVYTEDFTDFSNPERGWYYEGNPAIPHNGSPVSSVAPEPRLCMRYVRLDAYKSSAIPETFLNDLEAELEGWRSTKMKAVLRFAYNRSNTGDMDSLARLQAHAAQLAPIIESVRDVIAVHQFGFVGGYGEWDASTGITLSSDFPTEMHAAIDTLLDATPTQLFGSHRYPWMMYSRYNTPLNPSFRFTTGNQARWGIFNDCFCQGSTNTGTYTNWDGTVWEQDRAYWAAIAPYVVSGGETCGDAYATDWGSSEPLNGAPGALADLATYSWDYLNSEYSTSFHSRWSAEGNLAEISRRLGYRFVMVEAEAPTSVTAGSGATLAVRMKNVGFGKLYNPRPLQVVFSGAGGPFVATVAADARLVLPLAGQTLDINLPITVPAGLQSGQSYDVYLRLPDASPNLNTQTDRMIRFANTGVWTSGMNSLNMSVTAN